MNKTALVVLLASALSATAGPALTIYKQNFAVVRDSVPLDLNAGTNAVRYAGATAQVEPDSVILRDPAGKHSLQILEQNYRNDPVSQELLLSLFEGKEIPFQNVRMKDNTQVSETIMGKVIRSGHIPVHYGELTSGYDANDYPNGDVPGGSARQPIIEVDGKLQFFLPGQPLFPDLGGDTILKPAFNWLLQSDKPGKFDAEVGYLTGGFDWSASYNLVSPEKGDSVDLVGWITMNNESGKTFENARIKLMAGDVSKIQPAIIRMRPLGGGGGGGGAGGPPPVTEKSFDEFHLYSIARPTTLHDRETKQVEFVHAEKIFARTIYVYDGAADFRFYGLNYDQNYGQTDNKKVVIEREFVNDETNQLGIALPAGKLRFYRRDADDQLQFVGENTIDHTPRKETVRVTTGHAFDLVGERKQSDFKIDLTGDTYASGGSLPPPAAIDPVTGLPVQPAVVNTNSFPPPPWIDESFEIKLRNRKKEPVEIRVVERLYRWRNWEITKKSDNFTKKDSQAIEFRIPVKPDEEKIVTYTVHYSW